MTPGVIGRDDDDDRSEGKGVQQNGDIRSPVESEEHQEWQLENHTIFLTVVCLH